MNGWPRTFFFVIPALVVGVILLVALAGLPSFGNYRGPYGDQINERVEKERHTPQSVAAVTFDYRGFDTMGEEFILFAAVAGVLLLMRKQKGERLARPQDIAADRHKPPGNEGLQLAGNLLFPFAFVLGIYVIFHGHLSPGGGFQGGVLTATAFLFIYLAGEFEYLRRFTPQRLLDTLEAIGAAGFVLLGAAGLLAGRTFLAVILPLGSEGKLLSAGNLPLLNCLVGLEVASAFLLLLSAFLEQALSVRRRGK